jgi:DNA repair protein RadC
VLSCEEVHRGTLDASLVHPREVYKAAILANAANIIVAHNHPSGDPTPSPQDYAVTERLVRAGEILGIPLLDSLVIGRGVYYSMRDHGEL